MRSVLVLPAYFSRVFKDIEGVSPRQYREQFGIVGLFKKQYSASGEQYWGLKTEQYLRNDYHGHQLTIMFDHTEKAKRAKYGG